MSNRRAFLAPLALAMAACSSNSSGRELAERLADALASGRAVKLSSLTSFAWDRVYIFPPYTTPVGIREATGLDLPAGKLLGIDRRDDLCLLVFLGAGKLVETVEIPRDRADFAGLEAQKGLTPEQAVFVQRDRRVSLSTSP